MAMSIRLRDVDGLKIPLFDTASASAILSLPSMTELPLESIPLTLVRSACGTDSTTFIVRLATSAVFAASSAFDNGLTMLPSGAVINRSEYPRAMIKAFCCALVILLMSTFCSVGS